MARSKLSASDKSYIEQNYGAVTIENIAEDIECSVELVQEYINNSELKPSQPKPEKQARVKSRLDLAARTGGAVAMTEALSQHGDDVKNKELPEKTRNSIHRPFGKD